MYCHIFIVRDSAKLSGPNYLMIIQYNYIGYTEAEEPMIKSLTRHGNSYALVIDKPILELLRITPQTQLEITTDGSSLIISPVADTAKISKQAAVRKALQTKFGKNIQKID